MESARLQGKCGSLKQAPAPARARRVAPTVPTAPRALLGLAHRKEDADSRAPGRHRLLGSG